jgi:hypothetical protein
MGVDYVNGLVVGRARRRIIGEFQRKHDAKNDHRAAVVWYGKLHDGSSPECVECALEEYPERWMSLAKYGDAYGIASQEDAVSALRKSGKAVEFRICYQQPRPLSIRSASPEVALDALKKPFPPKVWAVVIDFRHRV